MEDYLEAIMLLEKKGRGATVTSISHFLDVKKPSVSAAILKLADKKLVEHQKYGSIVLTSEGKRAASDVYRRHTTLQKFLSDFLGVDTDTAERDACKLEHSLSSTSMSKLVDFMAATTKKGQNDQ